MQTTDMFRPVDAETDDLFTMHDRQCIDCGAPFQTAGRGRRCTHCLVKRLPEQPSVDVPGRRFCAYCRTLYKTALDYDGPPLCPGCAADAPATLQRIRRDIDSICAHMDAAMATFDVVAAEHPAEWDKLSHALATLPQDELRARWQARSTDPRYQPLLEAYSAREAALAPLGAERARLEDAERAINADA